MRLIDADALVNEFNEAQVEFDEYYKGLGRAKVITDNAPTVNDCPNCEYKLEADYICSSSSYKELIGLRKFKEENTRPQATNNAELFKQTFGIYATELWTMPNTKFMEWLNADVRGEEDGE